MPLQTGMTLPIFPLPSTVFYPGTPLPLHIFEPRYRQMTADALEGKRQIGMVLLKPGYEEDYYGKPQIFSVGCVGDIAREVRHPDGKYNFTLIGLHRFRIVREEEGKPYRQAEIELLEELNEQNLAAGQTNACRDTLIEHFQKFISLIPEGNPQKLELDGNPGTRLSEFVDRFAYRLDLSLEQKQAFLEEQDVNKRANFLHSFLKMKIDLIHLSQMRTHHNPSLN